MQISINLFEDKVVREMNKNIIKRGFKGWDYCGGPEMIGIFERERKS